MAELRSAVGESYDSVDVIAIDEAQFFPDLLEFCTEASDHDNKQVLVAGLDGDFKRQRFGQVRACTLCPVLYSCSVQHTQHVCRGLSTCAFPSQSLHSKLQLILTVAAQVLDLIPVSDSVTKLSADCAYCGQPALFSLRIAADQRQEVVGGADKYAPVCRHHYVSLSQLRGP